MITQEEYEENRKKNLFALECFGERRRYVCRYAACTLVPHMFFFPCIITFWASPRDFAASVVFLKSLNWVARRRRHSNREQASYTHRQPYLCLKLPFACYVSPAAFFLSSCMIWTRTTLCVLVPPLVSRRCASTYWQCALFFSLIKFFVSSAHIMNLMFFIDCLPQIIYMRNRCRAFFAVGVPAAMGRWATKLFKKMWKKSRRDYYNYRDIIDFHFRHYY